MLKDFQLGGESLELGNFYPEHVLGSERIAGTNARKYPIPLESDEAMLAILEETGITFEPIGRLAVIRRFYAGLWLDRLKCG
jgi:hypothetical protein